MSLRAPACSLKVPPGESLVLKVVFNIGISLTIIFTAFETVGG